MNKPRCWQRVNEKKKTQDRKFQEVGEAIAITHKKKMVETRAKTVLRIANPEYVSQEESKAGFIYNPLNESVHNQAVITKMEKIAHKMTNRYRRDKYFPE